MQFNRNIIGKLIKIILLIIVICLAGGILITMIENEINEHRFGFKEENLPSNRYSELFHVKYKGKIESLYSSGSRSGNYFNQYRYGSNDIFILELTQYGDVNVSDATVNNYILQTINNESRQNYMTIRNHKPPFLLVTLYHLSEKGNHANLYIGGESEKTIRDDKYLYVRFRGNRIVINTIKNYQELSMGFPGADDMPAEFMILKNNGKTLFILNIHEEGKGGNNVSLLELIDLKRI